MQAVPLTPKATEVSVFELVKPSGWSLNMIAAKLPGGALLLYSPTWMGEGTFEAVAALGEPTVLVAPNHFHHMSLRRFRDKFPKAIAVCSKDARPRLERQGHEGLRPIEDAASLLGNGMKLLPCAGTKTGETWLSVPTAEGRALVVCDAFFHVTRPVTGLMGFATRMLRVTPGFQISRTYTMLGVKDVAGYKKSANEILDGEDPSFLVPSHGEVMGVVGGERPKERAKGLVELRIR